MNNKKELSALTLYLDTVRGDLRYKTLTILQVYVDEFVIDINKVIEAADDKSLDYHLHNASTTAKANIKTMIIDVTINVDNYLYLETEKVIDAVIELGVSELIVDTYVDKMKENFMEICLPIAQETVQNKGKEIKNKIIADLYK